MADYIYLLETRLTEAQKAALSTVCEIARARDLTVFLVGGAVRDLTSGSRVRDLDVVVQGNALKLKKDLHKSGATISGEAEAWQALYLYFPAGVRMEVGSTLAVHYPKPGKPVMKSATILEDLRRRDFTANAMALSLNQGSYGLLMDPLNGVADIENRELRLVSNYGFIEDPVRMIRAVRFMARLGWQMEEKTRARYETGKAEGYISAMQGFQRGYEAEEIVHEEEPLRVMRSLENEGWLKRLAPGWSVARVNAAEMEKLRETQAQLQMRGIQADASAAQFPLLTAKMAAKDVKALKRSFPRQGFVERIGALEGEAKRFAAELASKQAATPSAFWKMLMAARPEVVLWVAHSTRNAALQARFQSFYTEWPLARQRIPYVQMQEMRIVPGVDGFDQLVEKIFFELMDGRLASAEEMKTFLEPYSPPAPPPTVHPRRARASKKDAKAKARKKTETDESLAESAETTDGNALLTGVAATGGEMTAEAGKVAGAKAAGTKPIAGKAPTAAKAIAAKPVSTKPSAGKPVASKVVAAKALTAKADSAKAVAKKVVAKKPVVKKVVPEKVIAKKAVAKKAVVKKAADGKVKSGTGSNRAGSNRAGSNRTGSSLPGKAVAKSGSKGGGKTVAKAVAAKAVAAKAVASKTVAAKAETRSVGKAAAKAPGKATAKSTAKPSAKKSPARKSPAKGAATKKR